MDGGEELEIGGWKHQVVKDGEWAGWVQYGSDPFEDHAGPFYYRVDETGQRVCAMRAPVSDNKQVRLCIIRRVAPRWVAN